MGISLRAYARHRGCSDTAVRKAVKASRISLEADGTIDPIKADQQWARNTDKAQQLKSELIDRAKAISHVFRLARSERDAWVSWPSRISAQMAAELDVDLHQMHVILESYVRQHLSELADIQATVD